MAKTKQFKRLLETGSNGHWIVPRIDIYDLPIGEEVCDMHDWWVDDLVDHLSENGGFVKHTRISLDVARCLIENIGRVRFWVNDKVYHYDNKKLVIAGRDKHFTTLVYQIDESRAGLVIIA